MSELMRKPAAQEQQERMVETPGTVKRNAGFAIAATAVAVLAVLGVVVLYAQSQDRTSTRWFRRAELRSPTSGDTRTGRLSLPPGPKKYSR